MGKTVTKTANQVFNQLHVIRLLMNGDRLEALRVFPEEQEFIRVSENRDLYEVRSQLEKELQNSPC